MVKPQSPHRIVYKKEKKPKAPNTKAAQVRLLFFRMTKIGAILKDSVEKIVLAIQDCTNVCLGKNFFNQNWILG